MEVGVELLVHRVDLLQAVALEHLIELGQGHFEAFVHVVDSLAFAAHLHSLFENVGDVQKILAEALNAEHFGLVDLFREPLSHVVALGDGPPVLVHDVIVLCLPLVERLVQLLNLCLELFLSCRLNLLLILFFSRFSFRIRFSSLRFGAAVVAPQEGRVEQLGLTYKEAFRLEGNNTA